MQELILFQEDLEHFCSKFKLQTRYIIIFTKSNGYIKCSIHNKNSLKPGYIYIYYYVANSENDLLKKRSLPGIITGYVYFLINLILIHFIFWQDISCFR